MLTHLFKALDKGKDIFPAGTGCWGCGGLIWPKCHHGNEEADHSRDGIDP